jgi:hypothetical protein
MHDHHIHPVLSKDFGVTGTPSLPFIWGIYYGTCK